MSDPRELAAVARAMIDENSYMTLATADESGRPWATPVWFASADHCEFVWVSDPGARHSRNIAARGEVGIVIFDSRVPINTGQAVYVEALAGPVSEAELRRALEVFSDRSERQGDRRWTEDDVRGEAKHRLYRAVASRMYVLDEHDERLEVVVGLRDSSPTE